MVVSFIVAASENDGIGINNQLPWHLPEDLKFFKRTTLGKPVIMGRKTYESLGRPLPGRLNIVLSKNADLQLPDGVLLMHDIADAIALLNEQQTEEAFIIGGGNIFRKTLEFADRIYLTRVHTTLEEADVFFPHLDHSHWHLAWEEAHGADEKHAFAYTFQRYERTLL